MEIFIFYILRRKSMKRLFCSFDNCFIDEEDGTYHYYDPIEFGGDLYQKFTEEINKFNFDICLIGGNFGWSDEKQIENFVNLYTSRGVTINRENDVFIVYDCFLNYKFKENDYLMCTSGIYTAFFNDKIDVKNVIFID